VDHPFRSLVILTFLPHVLGSLLNIPYNRLEIVEHLSGLQEQAFYNVVLVYNLVLYPASLYMLYRLAAPIFRVLRALGRWPPPLRSKVAAVRRQALDLPWWVAAISCIGWLPGGLVFPLGIDLVAGPLPASVYGHFLISFTISGLIAATYSFLGVQLAVLRGLYPRLWVDAVDLHPIIAEELGARWLPLSLFQFLAGMIPLAGAVLMVGVGPEISGYRTFRLLVTALIAMGTVGFGLANTATTILARSVAVFVGGERRPFDKNPLT
jgi:hypothetical protein